MGRRATAAPTTTTTRTGASAGASGEIILDEVSRVEDLGGSKNFLLHDLCSGVGAGVRKLDIVICSDTNLVTELINLDEPIVLA